MRTPVPHAVPLILTAMLAATLLAGCAATDQADAPQVAAAPPAATAAAASPPPAATAPPGTRSSPVVPGRPGRVFIFAGVDKACASLPLPVLTVVKPPSKGDVSFASGQETTIAASAQGTCIGSKAKGTGVYYTARAGMSGADSFTLTARLATGETMTRQFSVMISE